jgi:hypothetical protein
MVNVLTHQVPARRFLAVADSWSAATWTRLCPSAMTCTRTAAALRVRRSAHVIRTLSAMITDSMRERIRAEVATFPALDAGQKATIQTVVPSGQAYDTPAQASRQRPDARAD